MRRKSWAVYIQEARVRGAFSRTAKNYVKQWPQCAVGENVAAVRERDVDAYGLHSGVMGETGRTLYQLGLAFYQAVEHDQIGNASVLYKKIRIASQRL